MWFLLIGFMLLACAGGIFYLMTRLQRFRIIGASNHPRLWSFVILLPMIVGLFLSFVPTGVVMLHLMLFWFLCDLVGRLIKRLRKKEFKRYYQGIAAIVLCTAYLAVGWYNANHVLRTSYRLSTDKDIAQPLRIVLIADAHVGEVMSAGEFAEELKKIQAEAPDLIVVCGDYVDDDTSREDLLLATEALGALESTYGTYYVFGNHDKGYMNSRGFTEDDLRAVMAEHHITVLEDETTLIGESFYLIGRQDRSNENRRTIQELTADLDPTKYTVVLNHQPNDYDSESAAQVDLVLSGHTHGGHIFPGGLVGLMLGANDKVYGHEQRGSTDFIVTSGISGWGVPFKTFAVSEYVVIDIAQR